MGTKHVKHKAVEGEGTGWDKGDPACTDSLRKLTAAAMEYAQHMREHHNMLNVPRSYIAVDIFKGALAEADMVAVMLAIHEYVSENELVEEEVEQMKAFAIHQGWPLPPGTKD
jgi:hypothetical protein